MLRICQRMPLGQGLFGVLEKHSKRRGMLFTVHAKYIVHFNIAPPESLSKLLRCSRQGNGSNV